MIQKMYLLVNENEYFPGFPNRYFGLKKTTVFKQCFRFGQYPANRAEILVSRDFWPKYPTNIYVQPANRLFTRFLLSRLRPFRLANRREVKSPGDISIRFYYFQVGFI